jgi:hypothetical protein
MPAVVQYVRTGHGHRARGQHGGAAEGGGSAANGRLGHGMSKRRVKGRTLGKVWRRAELTEWRCGMKWVGGASATQIRWWMGTPVIGAGKTASGVVRWGRQHSRTRPGGGAMRTEDEQGLARWLEAKAEGDKGLGAWLQNGGGPVWGVPHKVSRTWGPGGRQGGPGTIELHQHLVGSIELHPTLIFNGDDTFRRPSFVRQ